jgi:hypothetical protein
MRLVICHCIISFVFAVNVFAQNWVADLRNISGILGTHPIILRTHPLRWQANDLKIL